MLQQHPSDRSRRILGFCVFGGGVEEEIHSMSNEANAWLRLFFATNLNKTSMKPLISEDRRKSWSE
jgi:hypothetical protein